MKNFTSMKLSVTVLMLALLLTACQQKNQPNSLKTHGIADSWQLMPELSSLSFITTKNKVITEQHTLQFKQGQLDQLVFNASIDLDSIDTQIDIRDQRMRDILFQTESNPIATINSVLPNTLNLGQTVELSFSLRLNKQQKTYTSQVLIQQVENKLVATNYEPINVNAKDFGLDDAVNQLTKIAGLQGINYDVLVDFKLTFEKSLI